MRTRLGHVNRLVAAILAVIWAAVGIIGLVIGCVYGRWLVAAVALFALWYAVLWVRVAARVRLLRWSEAAMPWRAH